ncbi:unnamed protein product [Allacma fusca]|uniref:Uncharacterized protein n=1 Tax=Allacma fusca TaxID=39272 RepID=A0A8J2LR56_9HEXA|nr:unnamed protein product [Allacma fusca]
MYVFTWRRSGNPPRFIMGCIKDHRGVNESIKWKPKGTELGGRPDSTWPESMSTWVKTPPWPGPQQKCHPLEVLVETNR